MFDYATAFAIFSAILLAGLLKGIIGVGFQTVGIAFLTVITNLPNAISLLLIPSLVTNLWQAGAGGELFTILIRLWPLIITASMMVWFGSIALTSVSLSYLSALLGVLLIIYSAFSLFGLRFEIKTKNEWCVQVSTLCQSECGVSFCVWRARVSVASECEFECDM